MSASINFHSTKSIKAVATSVGGSNWVEITFTDYRGRETEITVFFVKPSDAQIYADAINQAHAVVEPPDVEEIGDHAGEDCVIECA
jgi:hypothetical protein